MTRQVKRMQTPGGIGAGQTASVSLPLGSTFHELQIHMRVTVSSSGLEVPAAQWGSYLGEIRLLVDGTATVKVDAADLVKINQFHGLAMVPGVLSLHLSQPWLTTPGGQVETAYKTAGGISSLSLEMDIAAGVTVEKLEVYAVQSADGLPWGAHYTLNRIHRDVGVTGLVEIYDIPRGPFSLLEVHIDTANIAGLDVLANNRVVLETNAKGRAAMASANGRFPQTGMTSIDFQNGNLLIDALPMALQDFRIRGDFTATGNYEVYHAMIRPGGAR